MNVPRSLAAAFLGFVVFTSAAADWLAPWDYSAQFREHARERPSLKFPLGTDELGRDRFSRLLHATRISLLIAPVTALAATVLAAALGVAAGWMGGLLDAAIGIFSDLFLSLPWLFLLLTLRALVPLDAPPSVSVAATAILLACVGWAPGTRVVRASTSELRTSPCILHARAAGSGNWRLLWVHVVPNVVPALAAQFWILVPAFLLTEANLGILGLGVSEPLPSLGNMIAELRDYSRIGEEPWLIAPALVLGSIIASLHVIISGVNTCE